MKRYYEVLIADGRYHGDKPLTYSSEQKLSKLQLISVPIRDKVVNAFVLKNVSRPTFSTKPIKVAYETSLPPHSLPLAKWITEYYACDLGDALRQFAPSGSASRRQQLASTQQFAEPTLELSHPLTADQQKAVSEIDAHKGKTVLLHGDTGTGKTRVYLELAKSTLQKNRSVMILTPEIALTSQLASAVKEQLNCPLYILHSQLGVAERKKLWQAIASSTVPVVVIGARSALFSPVQNPGLIVLDEAHEPAYKQDQAPRYHAARVASQLASLTNGKVVLGSATPLVADYYLAEKHAAVVAMNQPANSSHTTKVYKKLIDMRDPSNKSSYPYLSHQLKTAIDSALGSRQQVMIYLNRRGSARLTLCTSCGWQLTCPRCDIPMVYHGDNHQSVCHTCGAAVVPPVNCPVCNSSDIIYKSAGTKTLASTLQHLYPESRIARFDSDTQKDEAVHAVYHKLRGGEIDILVGTQMLAKGLDLPKLGLVGVIAADTSLNMPDFTAAERTFQLLYQVAGRVGRGHGEGKVVVQTYSPDNYAIKSALDRDWKSFYQTTLAERQNYGFPPFVYLLKLECRRSSAKAAAKAAKDLKSKLEKAQLPVEIVGPTPSFSPRRGDVYYWQLVVKSKERLRLLKLADLAGSQWSADMDPLDLL